MGVFIAMLGFSLLNSASKSACSFGVVEATGGVSGIAGICSVGCSGVGSTVGVG